MKKFSMIAAQGDVLFVKINELPKNIVAVMPVDNTIIITHSETGHHHVMVLDDDNSVPAVEMFNSKDNPLLAWIKVNRPVSLEHLRSYDTHESITFDAGIYEIRRQREYTPEGWQRVTD